MINDLVHLRIACNKIPQYAKSHMNSFIGLKKHIYTLFPIGKEFPVRTVGTTSICCMWRKVEFYTQDHLSPIACQKNLKAFENTLRIDFEVYMQGNQQDASVSSVEIMIPMLCGPHDSDLWGLKKYKTYNYNYGHYTVTSKGNIKMPVMTDDAPSPIWGFGKSSKKLKNHIQYSVASNRDIMSLYENQERTQYLKILLNEIDCEKFDISCDTRNPSLSLPEVNILLFCAYMTNRTLEQVKDSILQTVCNEKTVFVSFLFECAKTLLERDLTESDALHRYIKVIFGNKRKIIIANFLRHYNALLDNANLMKGYYLENHIRCFLIKLTNKNYHPDKDSLQRKRFTTIGSNYNDIFTDGIVKILTLDRAKSKPKERVVAVRAAIQKILSDISSNLTGDITKGKHNMKDGIYISAKSSLFQFISTATVTCKKFATETTKLLECRNLHASTFLSLCPFDKNDHGTKVGTEGRLNIIGEIVSIYPEDKLKLLQKQLKLVIPYLDHKGPYTVSSEDIVFGICSEEAAYKIQEVVGTWKRKHALTFGISMDIFIKALRFSSGSGRIVQPIIRVINGSIPFLDIKDKILGFESLEALMVKYPDSIEFVDTEQLLVSSRSEYSICESIDKYMASSETMKRNYEYCLLSSYAYIGWVANHKLFLNYDEPVRNIFGCCQSKSLVMTRYADEHIFETHNSSMYTHKMLIRSPVMRFTEYDRRSYAEFIYLLVTPSHFGINQEDGIIVNKRAIYDGFLACTNTTRNWFEITSKNRTVNTSNVQLYSNQININPVTGLPIENTIMQKNDAIVRNLELINLEQQRYKDESETYFDYVPGRVDQVYEKDNVIQMLIRKLHYIVQGDKLVNPHAQKSTGTLCDDSANLPSTLDGKQPGLIMSPLPIIGRGTLSMGITPMFIMQAILGDYKNGTMQIIEMSPIQENIDLVEQVNLLKDRYIHHKDKFDSWNGETPEMLARSIRKMVNPITNEIVEHFFAPLYYSRSHHFTDDKKSLCAKGQVNKINKQVVRQRKASGAPKIDEMARNCYIANEAVYNIKETFSEPIDRREPTIMCRTCSRCPRYFEQPAPHHRCDYCLAKYHTTFTVSRYLPHTVKIYMETQRGRSVNMKLHEGPISQFRYFEGSFTN